MLPAPNPVSASMSTVITCITRAKTIAFGIPMAAGIEWSALLRSNFVDELQKIFGRIAFDVEFDTQFAGKLSQFMHVAGSRVAFVRPRMDGDPGGSGGDAYSCEPPDIGQAVVSRVSQQGDFVEVGTEGGHRAASIL